MDEKTFECEFCKKTFIKYGNLTSHQKTAKYCLSLRGKSNVDYECDFCHKLFSVSRTLDNHKKICTEKNKKNEKENENFKKENENIKKENRKFKKEIEMYKKEIEIYKKEFEMYKKQIEKLEDTISQIALSKSTGNTTNNISNHTNNIVVNNNNGLNLNDVKHIENIIEENLDGDVLAGGQKGLARMIYEKLLKGPDGKTSYKCVDSSRHNFEYLDENGNVEKDVKAAKLKQALIKGDICQKALDVGPELWSKDDGSVDNTRFTIFSNKVFEVANINNDDSKFRSELSVLTS